MNNALSSKTPFFSLYKMELGLDIHKPFTGSAVVLNVFWLVLNLTTLHFLTSRPGVIALSPTAPLGMIWILIVAVLSSRINVPAIWPPIPYFKPFEYLFTRAIDRKINFRAKSMALATMVLAPLLIGLILYTLFHPDLTLVSGKASLVRQYQELFPGSSSKDGLLLVRNGTFAFALWQIWCAIFGLMLLHFYYSLLAPFFHQRHSLLVCFCLAPWMLAAGVTFTLMFKRQIGIYETLFLTFCSAKTLWFLGLLIFAWFMQTFCEHRFAKTEIH